MSGVLVFHHKSHIVMIGNKQTKTINFIFYHEASKSVYLSTSVYVKVTIKYKSNANKTFVVRTGSQSGMFHFYTLKVKKNMLK